MFVDCGIEFANKEAAYNEILAQLEGIQNGNVTEEEIAETMLTFKNGLGSIGDSLNAIENWYTTCILDDFIISPEDDAKEVEKITTEDVIKMAKRAKLSTVFFLKGEEIDRAIESSYPEVLILDFGGVTFMDSSGIGLVMGRYKLMQNISGQVIIENAPKSIRKVFKMSGIDKLLTGEKRKEESFV